MNLSFWATVLWASDFVLHLALIFVLFFKRRYRTVPWFTAWITGEAFYTIALFVTFRHGSRPTYARVYWTADFLDVLLQIAVVMEIARFLLRQSGQWVEGSRRLLAMMAGTAPLVAGLMAWLMRPAASSRLDAMAARSSLFTTVLVCLLFTAVVMVSQRLGLGLRSHVMRESYGFILWSLVAFLTDSLHAYWGTLGHFSLLENVRSAVFEASLLYWIVGFWLPEPKAVPLSAGTINRLDSLASRLQYAQSRDKSSTGALPK